MVEISGIFQQSQSMQLSKLLVRVLEKLERLEVIRWECTLVPSNILLHLNQRQRTPRVYIKTHGTLLSRDYSDRPKFNSPSIWSFSTSLSPANFCQHNAVKNLIFSSPSLQTLRIRIRYGVESGLPVLFILDRNDVLPAIKTMKLTNCRFERNQAERWAQCLQADHLKSLTLDGTDHLTDLLIHLTGRVPNLTSLGLRIRPDRYGNLSRTCAALEKFLRGINALESFTAFDFPRSILSTVVTLQGPHLRTLRFRRTRFNGPGKSVFTFAELRSYALSLPRLERLGIDLCVYQPPCYSYDILLGIGRFPGLKHVELNVPFLRGEYAAYHVNALGAEMVFRHLSWAKMWYKKLRPQEGPWARFETLDIKLGEWEPIRPPLASGSPIRQQMYTCRRVSDSSDKPMTVLVTRGYEPGDDDNRYERALASAGLRDMADGL
ncbi:hypothetical protein AJ80_00285 [Polytolypa hystricis UAMH7299]|uniref:F-box domain-containing protein n=1 Tax=Polytolypa hystricis (strain UAMH7299) TaxID=1447883 RepID=A0A2B7Z3P9_POLH7|nr:hypothetical protein AJ80_00285 [Polytolypa hystricis UAMH7299]